MELIINGTKLTEKQQEYYNNILCFNNMVKAYGQCVDFLMREYENSETYSGLLKFIGRQTEFLRKNLLEEHQRSGDADIVNKLIIE